MVRSTNVSTPLDGLKNWNGAAVTYFEDAPESEVLASFDVAVVVAGYTYQDEGEYIPTLGWEYIHLHPDKCSLLQQPPRQSLQAPPTLEHPQSR